MWSGVGLALGHVQAALGAAYDVVHAGVHALVGGAMSAVQGGKFLDGFITHGLAAIGGSLAFASPLGAVPGNAGRMLRSAFAGTFGGLGAQLTGGKFANGFLTGAFAHLWNAESLSNAAPNPDAPPLAGQRYVNIDASTAECLVAVVCAERDQVEAFIGTRQMLMTETAFFEWTHRMRQYAGRSELARGLQLVRVVVVIPSHPSGRAMALIPTGNIGRNDILIFGTGDYFNLTTLSADYRAFRAAQAQGVQFDAFLHSPARLSRQ